jgi:DNA-binding NarL/FixJ family response regulator
MVEGKHRVLIVSERLLVAQGLKSLLAGAPEIDEVVVTEDLYGELAHPRRELPDVVVIDLPAGSDYLSNRPVSINGQEIKTIVLAEGCKNGQSLLYLHMPGERANLENFMSAILWKVGSADVSCVSSMSLLASQTSDRR